MDSSVIQLPHTTISVVVPVYSGAPFLRDLVQEFEALRMHWLDSRARLNLVEVLFVDDASIDDSANVLDALASEHQWISVLHLARNFGQHAATIAGILHTSGEWVITMDEDLQHPPANIPMMLETVARTRCDVVYAKAIDGVHEKVFRDVSSRIYKAMIERITQNPHIRNANSFRLMRGGVARAASSVCGHDTYFDIVLSWFTNRIETTQMKLKDDRYIHTGTSGYNLRSLLSHARKMLVSSNLKVLRLGAIFGFGVVTISVIFSVVLFLAKILNPQIISIQGWTSLILAIAFFGGMSLMFMGIILEYLSLLIQRAHGRPLFFTIDRSSDSALIAVFTNESS